MKERDERATWVYLDETAYNAKDGTRWRGAGALVLPNPMPAESVAAALRALEDDPDSQHSEVEMIDKRTRERGYFHAADDSKNAHSHWLKQVNLCFCGIFIYSIRQGDVRTDNEAFLEHLKFALMSTFTRCGRITAVFESRHGLGPEVAGAVVSDIYRGQDWTAYALPQVRYQYPLVAPAIEGKPNPGLQAVDFLLWACLQKLINPGSSKARWRERIEVSQTADTPDLGEGQAYGQLRGKRNTGSLALGGRQVYETSVIRESPLDAPVIDIYRVIERSLRGALRNGVLPSAEHLRLFAVVAISKVDKLPDPSAIADVGRAFLRLFDTAPLYESPIKDDQFRTLYAAKKLAAVMVRDDMNGNGAVLDTICRLRTELLRVSPLSFEPR
jgi:hypothetical protein